MKLDWREGVDAWGTVGTAAELEEAKPQKPSGRARRMTPEPENPRYIGMVLTVDTKATVALRHHHAKWGKPESSTEKRRSNRIRHRTGLIAKDLEPLVRQAIEEHIADCIEEGSSQVDGQVLESEIDVDGLTLSLTLEAKTDEAGQAIAHMRVTAGPPEEERNAEIVRRLKEGETQAAVARAFGLSENSVARIYWDVEKSRSRRNRGHSAPAGSERQRAEARQRERQAAEEDLARRAAKYARQWAEYEAKQRARHEPPQREEDRKRGAEPDR